MRLELRDHSKPCEHPNPGSVRGAYQATDVGPWICGEVGCPGGALRVFELDGNGKSLVTTARGSAAPAGRVWQRWVEWLDDERTTQ